MKLVQIYPVNRDGRTFIVGDIHGCYNQLMVLLEAVNFDFEKDILYCVGDLIDRGPDSEKCLLLVKEKWFRAVRGNHEELLIEAAKDPGFNWNHWIAHGGRWAVLLPHGRLKELAELAATLPVVITVGEGAERFNVFHAEFHGCDMKLDALVARTRPPVYLQQGRDLWEGKVERTIHAGLSPSFVGHTIVKHPTMIGSHIYIDTGSYYGERSDPGSYGISLIEPTTQKLWRYHRGHVVTK